MPGITAYAYLNWRDCLKKRQELRTNLSIVDDKKEDEDACRYAYRLYFNSIKGSKQVQEDDL